MVSVDSSAVSNVAEQNQGDVVRSIMTYGRKSSRLERMFPFRQMYVEPSRRNSKTSFVQ
ncbi:unnamed protein product [Soboliphyme baturini]|uniref:Uncharacterized protein n=1 Tax=Soboliphyme baturini TaxID=241478 RepID=A0A183JAC2_9BILA|nr:unnamed protein product [Soboliphyme baturini]